MTYSISPSMIDTPVPCGEHGDGDDDRHNVQDQLQRGEVERHGLVQDPAGDDQEGDHEDRDL